MAWPRVFIAESMSSKDFYVGALDGRAAQHVLEIEHKEVQYRAVLDRLHLKKAIREATDGHFDIFQLSCHGNATGIILTDGEELTWEQLAKDLKSLASLTRGLVMASCNSGHRSLADALEKQNAKFGWIFGAKEKPGYTDSCLAWSVLFRDLRATKEVPKKERVQRAIDSINAIIPGEFVYRRWDSKQKRYLHYRGSSGR